MKSALKKLIGRRRSSGSNEASHVGVSTRPQNVSAGTTLYRSRQSAGGNFTDGGSSAVTASPYHAASFRRCGICYFELPASAQPIETTGANGVVRFGNIVPPPSDLATRIVDLDINELRSRIFCIDTMRHSAERGCKSCSKMREILIRFNHHSTIIPTSDVLRWLGSRLEWRQEYPGQQPQPLFRSFELISSNPNVEDHPFVTKGLQPSGDTSVGLWRLVDWLASCNSSHMKCGTTAESPLPSRLLFIEKGSTGPVAFLTETAGMCGRYFCLSHRWGSAQPLRLTKQSLVAFKEFGIPWESMPQTFKDAAMLVLELGFNFLWIDSLCIIQDDEEDWKQEAASMGSIYQNSYLTIATTKCHGSDESLFSEINPVYEAIEIKAGNAPILFRKRLEHPNALDFSYRRLFEEDFPLLTRGWVYQERLLSPRMIHFAANELVWECLEESWCECSRPFEWDREDMQKSEKTRHSDLFDEIEDVDACEEWHKIVMKYTSHHLTFKKDRLPAISAVAKRLGATFGFTLGKYLGGLWEETLAYDFMWVNRLSYDLEQLEEVRPRQQPRPAPTWSWASIEDEVLWPKDDDDPNTTCRFIDFIRSEVTPSGPDEYGELKSGKLILSGFLKPGILRYSATDPPAVEVDANSYHLHLDYALYAQGEGYIESGTEVFCLQCGSETVVINVGQWQRHTLANCLVLLCIDREGGIYERIGIVRPPREIVYESWFGEEQILRSEITLV